jgi:signal transduction histidine kinase
MSELLDATIQSVRKISTELRPGVLDNLGLTAAIEWQVGDFQARTGILCEFESFAEEIQTDAERSTALFRICQEILTNVARHAGATEVRISLREEADGVVLEVRDNGRGITEGEIRGKGSLGLLGMRERAERLGGEFVIRGVGGGGTMVRVRIPCAGSESRAVSEGLNWGEAHDPVSGG